MNCPECGQLLPEGAQFCPACGVSVTGLAEELRRSRARRWVIGIAVGSVGFTLFVCNLLLFVAGAPDAAALLLSTIAAVVPAFVYTRLVLRLDRYEREPRRTVLATFGWGALAATFVAGILNAIAGGVFGAAVGPDAADALVATFVAPVVEETFKGMALLGLLLIFRDEFDTLLDGLVYGALVGLGFAMTENISYFSITYYQEGAVIFGVLVAVRTITGMFGHAMWTGTTGAALGWARGRSGRGPARIIVPMLGLGLAMAQHALWNGTLSFSGSFFAALGFLLLGFVMLFIIWRVALRRDRRILREYLADEVRSGVLTPAEYEAITNDKLRRKWLKEAKRRGGRKLRARQRQFFQTAAELAFRKYHVSSGDRPRPRPRRSAEEHYRAELARLRVGLA